MRISLATAMLAALLALSACEAAPPPNPAVSAATGGEPNPRIISFNDYKAALKLFKELDYTAEAWQAGIRKVPRVYLAEINDRWANVTTQEIDVNLKKRLFFRAIGPLALRSNELIMEDRERLLALASTPSASGQAWIRTMAADYGLNVDSNESDEGLLKELLLRVDIVPPSLVLAQAAEESGWGTSRFAFTGNALFGQWTWGGDGIRPEQQRGGKGDYKIAAFDAPLQSVQAHARNLNSHSAYADFRMKRARLRAAKQKVTGAELAHTLSNYSERGEAYVKSLRGIMSFNSLAAADDAYLDDGQAIVMINLEL